MQYKLQVATEDGDGDSLSAFLAIPHNENTQPERKMRRAFDLKETSKQAIGRYVGVPPERRLSFAEKLCRFTREGGKACGYGVGIRLAVNEALYYG